MFIWSSIIKNKKGQIQGNVIGRSWIFCQTITAKLLYLYTKFKDSGLITFSRYTQKHYFCNGKMEEQKNGQM